MAAVCIILWPELKHAMRVRVRSRARELTRSSWVDGGAPGGAHCSSSAAATEQGCSELDLLRLLLMCVSGRESETEEKRVLLATCDRVNSERMRPRCTCVRG